MPNYKTIDGVLYKQCVNPDCHKWYPATTKYFHKNHTHADGLVSRCKKCRNTAENLRRAYLSNKPPVTKIKIDVKKVLTADRKNGRVVKVKRLASIDSLFKCPVCGYGYQSQDKALVCCNGRIETTLPAQNTPPCFETRDLSA